MSVISAAQQAKSIKDEVLSDKLSKLEHNHENEFSLKIGNNHVRLFKESGAYTLELSRDNKFSNPGRAVFIFKKNRLHLVCAKSREKILPREKIHGELRVDLEKLANGVPFKSSLVKHEGVKVNYRTLKERDLALDKFIKWSRSYNPEKIAIQEVVTSEKPHPDLRETDNYIERYLLERESQNQRAENWKSKSASKEGEIVDSRIRDFMELRIPANC